MELDAISKRFRAEGAPVLDSLDLAVGAGEFIAIMGESGSGKSTLLNLIAGLDRPDAGSIRFGGCELTALNDDAITRWRRQHMGFVFQAFHILPYLTVLQNVMLPLDLLAFPPAARVDAATRMLAACGIGELAPRYPRELSGGQLQRTAIARALVHRPQLLLADEPTGNLDARSADQILQLLRQQLQETHAAGVLITHSMTAARSADRILQLQGGRLTEWAA